MEKNPFIFNDESKENSHGFTILTNGIDLTRFSKNPVMLDSHYRGTSAVLGKWKSIVKEGALLKGVPVFDSEDEAVKTIAGKVARGFINSCSMGIRLKREDLKLVGDKLVLTKCELYEVSIVAVPSNANSVRLFIDDKEEALSDKEAEELCLSVIDVDAELIDPKKKENDINMKIKLEAAVCALLGVAVGTEMEQADLQAKLLALGTEKATLATEKAALETQLSAFAKEKEQAKLAAITATVDKAVKAGKITADKKDSFVQLGISNEELLNTTLAAIPSKKSFGADINNPSPTDVKTAEDFQKLSLQEQLAFKAEQPDVYQKLFTIKK